MIDSQPDTSSMRVPPARRESARMLLMIFILGSVSFEQALDGLPHQLTELPESRFTQGLDMLIAGLCAT